MKVLLDTNAYSALAKGHEEVCGLVRRSERIYFSMVVVGELLAGFRNGSRYDENHKILDAYLESPFVKGVPVTLNTADRFGRIWKSLRSKGRPIPTNDIWIAAHAMETGAELVSFDHHFEQVEGLTWLLLKGGSG